MGRDQVGLELVSQIGRDTNPEAGHFAGIILLNDLSLTIPNGVWLNSLTVEQPIQPVEYIFANAIGYFEGNVIKYVSRWRKKNGIADLEKAKHYIELLIELETRNAGKGH